MFTSYKFHRALGCSRRLALFRALSGNPQTLSKGEVVLSRKPRPVAELIVCRTAYQASLVQMRADLDGHRHIRAVGPHLLSGFAGIAPRRVTVCEGVDLGQDVQGEGPLREILKKRQLTWGDRAEFIEL